MGIFKTEKLCESFETLVCLWLSVYYVDNDKVVTFGEMTFWSPKVFDKMRINTVVFGVIKFNVYDLMVLSL